jgi:CheY-like chemotaxis protein
VSTLAGLKILVVEDENVIREMLCEELESHGAVVTSAENGSVAFDLFRNKEFDITISDVRMPGGDGITLMRNIKSLVQNPDYQGSNHRTKLFLCSAFGEQAISGDNELKLNGIISKPFSLSKLVDQIATAASAS